MKDYRVAQKVIYRTLSSLDIDQFSQFFSPVDSVRNLLLTGVHTKPICRYTTFWNINIWKPTMSYSRWL